MHSTINHIHSNILITYKHLMEKEMEKKIDYENVKLSVNGIIYSTVNEGVLESSPPYYCYRVNGAPIQWKKNMNDDVKDSKDEKDDVKIDISIQCILISSDVAVCNFGNTVIKVYDRYYVGSGVERVDFKYDNENGTLTPISVAVKEKRKLYYLP